MNKDTLVTVTLRKVEWSHITVALTRIAYDSKASRLVKDEYEKIGRRIRAQVEHQINQPNKEDKQ